MKANIPKLVNVSNGDTLMLTEWVWTTIFEYEEEHDATEKLLNHGGFLHERRVASKEWSLKSIISYDFFQNYVDFFRRNHFQELEFHFGNRYMTCDLTGYRPTPLEEGNIMYYLFEMDFISYNPYWVKKVSVDISKTSEAGDGKHYYNNFPYSYGMQQLDETILDVPTFSNNFILTMFGEVGTPEISINSIDDREHQSYRFFIDLKEGEKLVVNNILKTATHFTVDGKQLEVYGKRDKTIPDIFKTPPTSNVSYYSNCAARIELYDNDFHSHLGKFGLQSLIVNGIQGVMLSDNAI